MLAGVAAALPETAAPSLPAMPDVSSPTVAVFGHNPLVTTRVQLIIAAELLAVLLVRVTAHTVNPEDRAKLRAARR